MVAPVAVTTRAAAAAVGSTKPAERLLGARRIFESTAA
jgi:hypothetical protein